MGVFTKATALLLTVLLCACGGGGSKKPEPSRPAFGWWGGAIADDDYLADAPGASLALFLPERLSRVAPMADRARSLGLRPVLMLWVLVRSADGMREGWQATLDAAVQACGDCDYYLADEPFIQPKPWTLAELNAVVTRLPTSRMVMMSLSTIELSRETSVPTRVTLGTNLYSSAGVTSAAALRYLNTLATYGHPMYLNLEAVVVGRKCSSVTAEQIESVIAFNETLRAWGQTKQIETNIAFAWQSSPEPFCGASGMPAVAEYIVQHFGRR